jgi:hypothetical protein
MDEAGQEVTRPFLFHAGATREIKTRPHVKAIVGKSREASVPSVRRTIGRKSVGTIIHLLPILHLLPKIIKDHAPTNGYVKAKEAPLCNKHYIYEEASRRHNYTNTQEPQPTLIAQRHAFNTVDQSPPAIGLQLGVHS